MAKRPATAKALLKELDGHIAASKAQLTVNFGGATLPLYLPNAGIVTGDDYGAMVIDGKPYLLELDRKGANKSVKVVTDPDATKLAAIVKQLLPEPEEPEEVKAAREALEAFTIPKGYKLEVIKGKPTLVASGGESSAGGRSAGGGEVTGSKKEPMPKLTVGMTLTRSKDGHTYTVTGLDERLKKAYFEPVTEGDAGLAAGYPAPVFWRNWQVA